MKKDKKFPIVFLILAIALTFGIFFISSMNATITGSVIGDISSEWTIVWAFLILLTIFVGLSILHEK